MEQLRKLLVALTLRQRITILTAALVTGGLLYGLIHWHKESDFKPLYAALAPEDAAAVIEKLKASGVEYRLSESGTAVLAPSARVPELRLQLAAAGVPHSGRIGYELFDKSNFGATDFAEQLNYHRALEGELERSIAALEAVEQARVHISFPKDSVFLESRQPAKASVMLHLRPGARLSQQNIQAVTNLVGSAVEGLAPEAVSVMDVRGNLLNRPRKAGSPDDPQPSEAGIEYRQKLENDLMTKVNAELEPLLGADKFRAAVSVDCDLSSGEQSEETLDPTKSAMLTSQKSEEATGTSSAGGGVPGTASNLPRPAVRAAGGSNGLTRRTENVTYQTSRVVRKMHLPQGTVKRVSLSVLLDHAVRWEGQGKARKAVVTPPSPEKIKVLHDLLAGVIGFSQERGDQIIIEALPFESTSQSVESGPMVSDKPTGDQRAPRWLNKQNVLMFGGASAVLLVMVGGGLFLAARKKKSRVKIPAGLPQSAAAAVASGGGHALPGAFNTETLNGFRVPVATSDRGEATLRAIRESAVKNSPALANAVRTWLQEADAGRS
jgi:flagellar M-ring protein FliF